MYKLIENQLIFDDGIRVKDILKDGEKIRFMAFKINKNIRQSFYIQ